MAKNKLMMAALKLLLGLSLLLLTACASDPVENGIKYSRASRLNLYKLDQWSFEGRIALVGQKDSWSANITWDHVSEVEKIKISGPLGQGAVIITMTGDSVEIDRGGGDVKSSNQPDEFINAQLGMFVPVQSLKYWVVGLPEPNGQYRDTEMGFDQSGWLNEFAQMQVIEDGGLMPRKVTIMNNKIKLKLIINNWILNDKRKN